MEDRILRLKKVLEENLGIKPREVLMAYYDSANRRNVKADTRKILKGMIAEKLVIMEATFEEWDSASGLVYNITEFKKPIADNLAKTAKTFNHWQIVSRKYAFCAEYFQQAIGNMRKLASTEMEIGIICKILKCDCNSDEIGGIKADEIPNSFDEWLAMSRIAHREAILELLHNMDVGLEILYKAYRRLKRDSLICRYIFEKIKTVDATLEEWCRIYADVSKEDELKDVAFERIKKLVMN